MSNLLKSLWMVFILNVGVSLVGADEPNIPANLWEQHPEGVAIALILTSRMEDNQQKSRLKIYIKNTSTADEWFYMYDNTASQLEVHYIGDNGADVPLRNYTYSDETGVVDSNVSPTVIKPNETIEQSIELTPEELAIVKLHPIKCNFFISNQKAAKGYKIKSSPRQLTETPGK